MSDSHKFSRENCTNCCESSRGIPFVVSKYRISAPIKSVSRDVSCIRAMSHIFVRVNVCWVRCLFWSTRAWTSPYKGPFSLPKWTIYTLSSWPSSRHSSRSPYSFLFFFFNYRIAPILVTHSYAILFRAVSFFSFFFMRFNPLRSS